MTGGVTSGIDQAALGEATGSLRCADIVDAVGRLHRHRCHILDLVTPTPCW